MGAEGGGRAPRVPPPRPGLPRAPSRRLRSPVPEREICGVAITDWISPETECERDLQAICNVLHISKRGVSEPRRIA